jgi:hypothetical protein
MPIIPAIWRTRPTTPEQRLAAAILAQAFTDMFATDNREKQAVDTVAVSAMRYLTARHGHSAQWRNQWCDCLDLDGDMLATRVRMILEGQLDLPGEPRLAVARDRWARITQRPAPSDTPKRLPTIKPAPKPPSPKKPNPVPLSKPAPPPTIDPEHLVLTVPDDAFYLATAGHVCASRRWKDGETSRFLGPLPSLHTKVGQALWAITQISRVGHNTLSFIGDRDQVIADLRDAFPNCDLYWTSKGKRLPTYQPNAGLRLYLKQLAKAA